MLYKAVAALFSAASLVSAQAPTPFGTFGETLIYNPPVNRSILYPRITELLDGTLLATASQGGDNPPYFPIFASTDGGASWTHRSNLTDQVNGLGFAAQPALETLKDDLAGYKAGAVLASGNSWGANSTNIDLYISTDAGYTWKFLSNVARGSHPGTNNGNPCIWEPKILSWNNTVGVFYSDQRDPLHGQKLAHQVSTDLKTWGPVVNDVAMLNYTDRPGMTNIAFIEPANMWIFVHEYPGGDNLWSNVGYPVYYHLAVDPYDFQYGHGGYPITVNGVQPNASPYVVWTPAGGVNGTIIVSDADHSSVFTNTWLGAPDKWQIHKTPEQAAYSRALLIPAKYPDHLVIVSGGSYGAKTTNLTVSVVSVEKTLCQPPGN